MISEASPRAALEEARDRASLDGKRVAVVFGADWCPDSRALDAALVHPLVQPIVDRGFVVVKIDVGRRDRNLDLMAEYGMDVWKGIPAVAILEPDGTLLAAQREGEFRNARSLSPLEVVSFFHPHFRGT
ncbi:MAG: thioredoxin family protein [Thermoanaerobaculia bacterium]